jgi:hypothetical protein
MARMSRALPPLPEGVGQHRAEGQPQGPYLLLEAPLQGTQPRRTLLQQDQTVPRIATRFDKTAENFLAAVKLFSVRVWLRGNASTA